MKTLAAVLLVPLLAIAQEKERAASPDEPPAPAEPASAEAPPPRDAPALAPPAEPAASAPAMPDAEPAAPAQEAPAAAPSPAHVAAEPPQLPAPAEAPEETPSAPPAPPAPSAPPAPPPPVAQPEPAQYLPPPQGPPPLPPQAAPPATVLPPAEAPAPPRTAPPSRRPPPQPHAPPPQTRDSWYIGFGVGAGDGAVTPPRGGASSFRELLGGSATNVFLNFKVGATITPTVLVGLDVTATSSVSDRSAETSSVGISNVDAVLTWFPAERGFFFRGGLGRSSFVLKQTLPTPFGGTTKLEVRAKGFNFLGGLGYAFWVGQSFNLTLNLEGSRQGYTSGASRPDDSTFWSVWAGFDWY